MHSSRSSGSHSAAPSDRTCCDCFAWLRFRLGAPAAPRAQQHPAHAEKERLAPDRGDASPGFAAESAFEGAAEAAIEGFSAAAVAYEPSTRIDLSALGGQGFASIVESYSRSSVTEGHASTRGSETASASASAPVAVDYTPVAGLDYNDLPGVMGHPQAFEQLKGLFASEYSAEHLHLLIDIVSLDGEKTEAHRRKAFASLEATVDDWNVADSLKQEFRKWYADPSLRGECVAGLPACLQAVKTAIEEEIKGGPLKRLYAKVHAAHPPQDQALSWVRNASGTSPSG
jgi:hypothetical protein